MSGYLLKPADRDAAFTMDWREGYLAPGETVAADLGWSIQPQAPAAGDLVVTEQHHDVARSWARFAGGVPGRVYLVAGRGADQRGPHAGARDRPADCPGPRPGLRSFAMILTEVSAPPAAAVPVRAFAEHLRLGSGFADDGSQDAVLELYLRAAMAAIEARLGRALLARDFSWTVTRWREDACQGLPIAPVRSVAAVTLVDAEGVRDGGRSRGLVGDARQPAAAAGRASSGGACRGSRGRARPRSASAPGSARPGTRCRRTCGRRCSCWRRISTRTAPRARRRRGRCRSACWC